MYFFKKLKLISSVIILSLIIMTATPIVGMAETINTQPTVDLGSTSSFAVLAGSTITNTGTTTISGIVGENIGLYPGTSFTGQESIVITTESSIHLSDDVAIKAKDDLVIAYDDAASRTPAILIPSELGGSTLTPGTYASKDGTFEITGTLTLDAQGNPDGVFIFQTASTLTTAVDSNITLINGARFCRTFWQVGSSATLGVNSHFVGHIFASESITANNGATIQGQLLAKTGAVTLDNNIITNGICDNTMATLHVIKHVINDNGRTAVASDFNIHVKNLGIEVNQSPAPGAELPGTTYILTPGTYNVSEDNFSTYSSSFSGDSDSYGNITLEPGDNKTITITNNDIRRKSDTTPTVPEDDVTPTVPEDDVTPTVPVDDVTVPVDDVTPIIPVEVVTETVEGGQLPYTSTGLYNWIIAGIALTVIGAITWKKRKHYE